MDPEFDTGSLYSNMWFVSSIYPICHPGWQFDENNQAFPSLVTEIPL
jgi:hypothetical protein